MSFILNPSRFSTGGADPGLTLLESATLWLDASDMTSGAQWLRNKGTGGRALDARVGSVGSAQIINGALKLNGNSGNYASTPDAAALDVTGEIDLVLRVGLIDWTPAFISVLASKWGATNADKAYILYVNTSGTLVFAFYDGSAERTATSAAPSLTDATTYWIRCRRTTDGVVRFYQAADQSSVPSSWTQIGSDVAGTAGSLQATTSTLMVGRNGDAANPFPCTGDFFRCQVWSGNSTSGGTVVFDADFTAQSTLATSFTESSSNAATVTINSTSGVDTNDPLLLTHTGTNYLYLPGSASNVATSPDSAALDITGDIDLQAYLALDDWTSGVNQTVVYKGNGSYGIFITGAGAITLFWNGAALSASSTANIATADGAFTWVRATMDVDNGAGSRVIKFYTSPDGTTWTQLGSTVTTAGTTSITADAVELRLGTYATSSSMMTGKLGRVRILNGYDGAGSVVFDADFTANTNQSSFTESSSNAATVTINRATSGRKAVMVVRPTLLFGTDDYLEVADNDLLDFNAEDFTVLAVVRVSPNIPGDSRLVSKRTAAAGNDGWELLSSNNGTLLDFYGLYDTSSGTTGTSPGIPADIEPTSLTRSLVGFVVDDSAGTLAGFLGSALEPTRTLPVNRDTRTTTPVSIGRFASGAYIDGEIEHVAIFRSALTSTELADIATYLGV